MYRPMLSVGPGCTGPAAACATVNSYLVSSFDTGLCMSTRVRHGQIRGSTGQACEMAG